MKLILSLLPCLESWLQLGPQRLLDGLRWAGFGDTATNTPLTDAETQLHHVETAKTGASGAPSSIRGSKGDSAGSHRR